MRGGLAQLTALILCLGGCQNSDITLSTNAYCGDKVSCPPPLLCQEDMGICGQPSLGDRRISVFLHPPGQSLFLPDQRYDVTLTGNNQYNTALTPLLEVGGVIKEFGNPLNPSIPAQLVAEAKGDIPGTVLRSEGRAIEGVNESFEAFRIAVIPGRNYQVFVFPDDPGRPPQVQEKSFYPEDDDFLITLPQKEGFYAYPSISGTLYEKTNDPVEPIGPAQNVRIVALSKTEANAPLLSSTEATPDPKFGLYELRVAAIPASYELWVQSEFANGATTRLPLIQLESVGGSSVAITGNFAEVQTLGDAFIEPRNIVPALLRVETTDSNQPLNKVSIRMHANLSSNETTSTYGLTGQSAPGVWKTTVIPGTYNAEVIPPRGSGYAAVSRTFILSSESPEETFQLPLISSVRGQVLGWDGNPVRQGMVYALRQDITPLPPFEARTDTFGNFEIPLNPGVYRLVVVPREESPYPRWKTEVFEMGGEDTIFDTMSPYAVPIRGVITNPEGEPVAETRVEFYEREGTTNSHLMLESLLGVGSTDENGQYHVLIPAVGTQENTWIESEDES